MSNVNDIPNGWVETTLEEVCKIKYGKDHKKLKDGKIPCYGSGGIMRYVDSILYDKPSVLIPRKGTLSNLFFINEPFWTVDTLFYTQIDESIIEPHYLYYKLKTYNLEDLNVGSAVPSLTTSVLNQFTFSIPKDIKEQKAIANILTAFDDKIENLQAQNKTLEQTAQTIFKEWFGKYQVGDELPEGWRVGKLSDFGEIITGKTPSKYNSEYWGNDIPFITPTDFKNFGMYSGITQRYLSKYGWDRMKGNQVCKNSIMVTCIGSDMGKVCISSEESITNQQLNSIVLYNTCYLGFVYEYIKSQYQSLRNIALGGSTMPIINKSDFSNISILIPVDEFLIKFHNVWEPISLKIIANSFQIQTLKKIRDTLLPKLMSGQIRVNQFKD